MIILLILKASSGIDSMLTAYFALYHNDRSNQYLMPTYEDK